MHRFWPHQGPISAVTRLGLDVLISSSLYCNSGTPSNVISGKRNLTWRGEQAAAGNRTTAWVYLHHYVLLDALSDVSVSPGKYTRP
jgi:hypothetical protein